MDIGDQMQAALEVLRAKGCKCNGAIMLEGRDLKCSHCDLQVELGQPCLTEFEIEATICNSDGVPFKMLAQLTPHCREAFSMYSLLSLRLRGSNGMLPPGTQEKLVLYRRGQIREILYETTITNKD